MAMPDFPIDPELRIPARPPVVLRRTTEAVGFIRKMTLSRPGHAWRDVLQSFEAARDEWSAMEAVVHLELLLEAEGLLIEERTAHASPLGKIGFAPPRSKSRNVGAVSFGPGVLAGCGPVEASVRVYSVRNKPAPRDGCWHLSRSETSERAGGEVSFLRATTSMSCRPIESLMLDDLLSRISDLNRFVVKTSKSRDI